MTPDGLRVHHAGLDTAAEDMYRTVTAMDERLDRLAHELAPLRSDWTGAAQQAYTAAKAQWDQAILEMRDLLGETSRTVTRSNAEYRAADQRGAASFGIR
jgi:6 kDa early secretory antigenic target